ncbi:MAG: hypothetical protein GY810_08020 [Aureispira sp.]|nr:hypothetical protein [Aureispira sp.]
MNDFLKKTMYAGLGLAVVTREKAEKLFDELAEKGKEYRKEEETSEQEEVKAESVADQEDASKHTFFEDYEQKLRKLVENTFAKFNFMKSDEQEHIANRIEQLEEKLSKLVEDALAKRGAKKEKKEA